MATITSTATGNFSDTATWVGGVVPTSVDDAVAATGHVVTIDTDVTVISFQQAGTGKFVLGGGRTVTGNVIANAGTFTSGGTVEVTATTGTTATINGNVTGVSTTAANTAGIVITGVGTLVINGSVTGSPGNASSGENRSSAVYINVACTVSITGSINGGTGSHKFAVLILADATVTMTGAVLGNAGGAISVEAATSVVNIFGNVATGSAHAVNILSSSTVNITGNVQGSLTSTDRHGIILAVGTLNLTGDIRGGDGPGNDSSGVSMSSGVANTVGAIIGLGNGHGLRIAGGTLNHVGTTIGSTNINGINNRSGSPTINVIGTVTASGTLGHGINSVAVAANTGVVFQGNMIDGSGGAVAVYTRLFRITGTQAGYNQHQNTVGFPDGTPVFRVSPDQVTGMPAINNVRLGTVYGYNNQLTGTVAIPPAGSVALGVEVDNTTGTAALDAGSVIAVIGAQIAAASSDPVGI